MSRGLQSIGRIAAVLLPLAGLAGLPAPPAVISNDFALVLNVLCDIGRLLKQTQFFSQESLRFRVVAYEFN